jgi:hypothetical protein
MEEWDHHHLFGRSSQTKHNKENYNKILMTISNIDPEIHPSNLGDFIEFLDKKVLDHISHFNQKEIGVLSFSVLQLSKHNLLPENSLLSKVCLLTLFKNFNPSNYTPDENGLLFEES